jgi:hypothetical protein
VATDRNDAEPDAELDHVVRNLFDVELERLAFGRAQTDDEQRWATAGAAELARREADGPARRGDTVESEPPQPARATRSATVRAGSERARINREREARPWWRQSWAVIAASVLAVIAATSIAPALTDSPIGASSLDVFAREATVQERELAAQLQREGLRLSVAPRIIAERDGDQVLAYRFIVTSPGESARNEVCLLLLDERALGLPTCVDRLTFVNDGMLATLSGEQRLFVVQWGPTGGPSVSVLPPDDPAPTYPESEAAEAFLAGEQSEADLAYSAALRALHPDDRLIVRVLATTPTWDAVGALVASADTGLWSYCVHLFQPAVDLNAQLSANVTCAGLDAFERDGLVAQARTAEGSLLIDWQPDDTVMVQEAG